MNGFIYGVCQSGNVSESRGRFFIGDSLIILICSLFVGIFSYLNESKAVELTCWLIYCLIYWLMCSAGIFLAVYLDKRFFIPDLKLTIKILIGLITGMAFSIALFYLCLDRNVDSGNLLIVYCFASMLSLIFALVHRMVYARGFVDGSHADCTFSNGSQSFAALLQRDEINVDMQSIGAMLKDKSVLITGAAGSLGSVLVEEIARFRPLCLILIDQAETPLHDVRLSMENHWREVQTVTIVADIVNRKRMEDIFSDYCPDYVFHVAAYKHVPMMEDNPREAIENNVEGTRVMADMAVKYNVGKFVMVSTDKAVNPTNVMGCSKRICELYVQALDKAIANKTMDGSTRFVTTRFGNVLGSNGSVVKLFQRQIEEGGPVTVTDKNMIRYFMLVSEACRLVLEAGTMGNGGEIFVFDMGEPVRIFDIAMNMIAHSGKKIDIVYTGARRGEKIYEEVLTKEEKTLPTIHPKIRIAKVRECDYKRINSQIDNLLRLASYASAKEIVAAMHEVVPEYMSNNPEYMEDMEKMVNQI